MQTQEPTRVMLIQTTTVGKTGLELLILVSLPPSAGITSVYSHEWDLFICFWTGSLYVLSRPPASGPLSRVLNSADVSIHITVCNYADTSQCAECTHRGESPQTSL